MLAWGRPNLFFFLFDPRLISILKSVTIIVFARLYFQIGGFILDNKIMTPSHFNATQVQKVIWPPGGHDDQSWQLIFLLSGVHNLINKAKCEYRQRCWYNLTCWYFIFHHFAVSLYWSWWFIVSDVIQIWNCKNSRVGPRNGGETVYQKVTVIAFFRVLLCFFSSNSLH
jgi:hypothetical protein